MKWMYIYLKWGYRWKSRLRGSLHCFVIPGTLTSNTHLEKLFPVTIGNIVVKASSRMTANNEASRFHVTVTVALYTILQRFQYHMCINHFPLADVYHIPLGRRSIIQTYSVRLHMEDSFRTYPLLLWQLLIEMLGFLDGVSRFLRGESQQRKEEKTYPCANGKKNSPSGTRPILICVFRQLKHPCF